MLKGIAKYIDHTLLHANATDEQIIQLCAEALQFGFVAVCVNPVHVRLATRQLSGSEIKVASVVGFPLGANLTDIKVSEAQVAILHGAQEIDMVINVGALKQKNIDYVRSEIEAINRVISGRILKVIIECDLLSREEKVLATELCIEAGATMVKTSTGFVKDGAGATVEDVLLMSDVIGTRPLAIKASGGIRDYTKAKALIEAGASRLGTSAGVAIVSAGQNFETNASLDKPEY